MNLLTRFLQPLQWGDSDELEVLEGFIIGGNNRNNKKYVDGITLMRKGITRTPIEVIEGKREEKN